MARNQTQAQLDNLKHGVATQFNSETAASAGRKGATSPKRKVRKTLREELLAGLETKVIVIDKSSGKKTKKTIQEVGTIALLQKYSKGDTRAFELVRDSIGEKPVDVVAVSEIDPSVISEIESLINE